MAFSTSDYTDWSLRGEGGEAEIFRARQVSLDRLVAIKRLKLSSIGDANDILRFEREAKLCASLIHPNLVPIFDYGSEGKFYYLIMEFVYGIDLGKIADLPPITGKASSLDATGTFLRGDKPTLPESLKVHLARQMVEVVDFIQQKGVLHRDLKPENFMADSSARIKLLDLGMAQVQRPSTTQTDPKGNALKGTLAYIPPEILRGQGSQGMVSEHYSLAVVLLELFQGSRYYRGKSSDEVVNLIQSGIPLEELDGVPASIKALLAPYLSPILNKRPLTLEPLLRGLKGMQGNTLAIAGGREALDGVIHREQYAWLWAMVRASEAMGRIEEAVARIRELLEVNPEDAEAQAKFQELVMRLNDIPEAPLLQKTPEATPEPVLVPAGAASGSHTWLWLTTSLALLLLVASATYYYKHRPRSGDMGRDLMEREMTQLSKEDGVDSVIAGQVALAGARKPSVRPYGILIVSGLPKDFQVVINKVRYPAGNEIHLPAAKHLLEIQDKKRHSVIRDSIEVGGGEPTVFDFQRRIGKQ
jgi:serine/threonine protein kinase